MLIQRSISFWIFLFILCGLNRRETQFEGRDALANDRSLDGKATQKFRNKH